MRIVIAEEALQTGTGHWPSYIGGLARAFRDAGDSVEILVHRAATPAILQDLGATPCFTRNCWLDSSSQGAFGGLRHNLTFGAELGEHLRAQEPPVDWCLALTMRLQHLLALARLSRSGRIPARTRFLLLFVQGFGIYQGREQPVVFPSSISVRLARLCFRIMRPAVESGRVVLAAETRGMQEELGRFTGLRVRLFPHPVPGPEVLPESPSREKVVLTAPGFARHEKGTDLLQEAISRLLADSALSKAHYVLQWPETFNMPDGSELGPNEILTAHERVELVNENLDVEAYLKLLDRSSLILLPYRRNSYHNRLSRVAIEAAGRGKPMIYMRGTWAEEIAELAGTGIAIEDESPEALEDAIRKGIHELPVLLAAARKGAPKVAAFHTGQTFRQMLVEELKA